MECDDGRACQFEVSEDWLMYQGIEEGDEWPEYRFGDSRIDFYMEKEKQKYLMEVKGCTLERGGIGYFPDAPTDRGVKHLRELAKAASEGYRAYLTFVIQIAGVTKVFPNIEMHPEFGVALKEAEEAGVRVLYLPCRVTRDAIYADSDQKTVHDVGF